jgi:hypothetical protein
LNASLQDPNIPLEQIDASHNTIAKNYNKVKLFAGIASTFTPGAKVKRKDLDRGIPVFTAMATAEDWEIHDAIVECLRMQMPADWVPEVLMSDMASSAKNSFKAVFPKIRWVW